MNYEGQICRAPMERASFMLPVAVGCSYNQCIFCTLFKHLKYRELPVWQVEEELKRVKNIGGCPKKIFLGDGNAFGLKTSRLLEILGLIRQYFPEYEMVNMDATVTNIRMKSDEELRMLHDAGVGHLYLGIESGLEDVLAFMHKDHNLAEVYEAIERLQAAGMIYDAHMMTGAAGRGRGLENAECIAEFFNKTRPGRIVNFSMFLHGEAPLYKEIAAGRFTPADELENLEEERRLLELLDAGSVEYDGFHDFIKYRVRGKLPEDRKRMLSSLDKCMERYRDRERIFAYIYAPQNVPQDMSVEDVWYPCKEGEGN